MTTKVPGVRKFKLAWTPTQMSQALCEAGIIPGTHIKRDLALTALLRHPTDRSNTRPSSFVAF